MIASLDEGLREFIPRCTAEVLNVVSFIERLEMLHLDELSELDRQLDLELLCQCANRLLHQFLPLAELVPEFLDLLKFLNVSFVSAVGWLSLDHHFLGEVSDHVPFIGV